MKAIKTLHGLVVTMVVVLLSVAVVDAEASIKIKHKGIKSIESGHRLNVSVNVNDTDNSVDLVRTYFKSAEGDHFYFIPMAKEKDDTYVGTLPAPSLGSQSFEYLFVVKNSADEVVKSEKYSVSVKDDPEALKRLNEKPAREVRLDISCRSGGEEALRKFRQSATKEKKDEDEPDQEVWVPVCNEYEEQPTHVEGFDDYLSVGSVEASEKLGVVVGLVGEEAAGTTVAATGLVDSGTVTAASTGIGVGTIAVGAAVVAVAAASSDSGGSSAGGGGGTGTNILGFTLTPPNGVGTQVAPLFMQFNEFNGVAVPISVTYNGAPMGSGTVPAGGTLDIPQPGVGGLIKVTLTANVAGASVQFHFRTNGGRAPAPGTGYAISGNAGDYVLLQTQ